MIDRTLMIAAAAATALATASLPAAAADKAHWSYGGDDGPENWAGLSSGFAACGAGVQQSPVDIHTGETVEADLEDIDIDWTAAESWTVVNNGHTIQVQAPDAGHVEIDGERYALLQFHFHSPSEHAIDGERAPMEAHFVHRGEDGGLAVIGVMMTGGGSNELFERIMASAPAEPGEAPLGPADAADLLPRDDDYYRYQGSLTTPPCSEIVLWSVMERAIAVSDAAIAKFRALYPMNARPLQALNRRYVLED